MTSWCLLSRSVFKCVTLNRGSCFSSCQFSCYYLIKILSRSFCILYHTFWVFFILVTIFLYYQSIKDNLHINVVSYQEPKLHDFTWQSTFSVWYFSTHIHTNIHTYRQKVLFYRIHSLVSNISNQFWSRQIWNILYINKTILAILKLSWKMATDISKTHVCFMMQVCW